MLKKITPLIVLSLFVVQSCSSDNDKATNNSTENSSQDLVSEFTSLNEKANYEEGSVTIDGQTTSLSYTGMLLFRESTEEPYEGLVGIAVFDEESFIPRVVMSSSDGQFPDFQQMKINIPDAENGYRCTDISSIEKKSTVIKDALALHVNAEDCVGLGSNEGELEDISMLLTQSMFSGGTSVLEVNGDTAHLNTEIVIDDNFMISGGLGTRAYNQVFDLQNNPQVTMLELGQISGSIHDDINMQTGRLVRQQGLNTHVTSTSEIASGGVDLFCSGNKRTMEDGAKLGVHSWTDGKTEAGELPVDSPLHNNQIAYFTEMLGEPQGREFYFFTINAAPASEIYLMSWQEIEQFGILN
ncbi:MAG: hypothetical protein KDJ38_03825 [Gammaproteobacteria bacterium]|nr:hypothetical protein [Gammaproteobacteria bacterium]